MGILIPLESAFAFILHSLPLAHVSHRSYWTLYFDASPQLMHQVERTLAKDPRVIRRGVIKLGSSLENMVEYAPKTMFQHKDLSLGSNSASISRQ